MREDCNERRRHWVVVALGVSVLASCTTYKPLDGGSQVPWAGKLPTTGVATAPGSVVTSELLPPDLQRAPSPQPAKAAVALAPPTVAPAPASGSATQHRVAAGDRLGALAQAYGVS